ncbi:MAG: RimK family alpha-L-glutamate ligase [bacterium]
MKIAILTQSKAGYENKKLHQAAKELGHQCTIVNINDVVIEVGGLDKKTENGAFVNGENLTSYDLIIFRFIFSAKKRAMALSKLLRYSGVKVMDNNLEQVGYNIDKIRDSILFHVNNIPYPKSINVLDEDDFTDSCNEMGYPVIVKHTGSGKGQGVYKFDDIGDVEDFIEKIEEKGKKLQTYLIQEFVPYVMDIRVLVISGNVVGAMQRIPKEGEFKANFSRGGSVKMIEIDDETRELARKAAEVTRATNAGVDVLVAENGTKYILEVNRTPGFEGFEKATGMDIATLIIEEAIKNAY